MKFASRHLVLPAAFLAVLSWSANGQDAKSPDKPLPDGDGKDLVQKTCTACHGIDQVTSETHTEAEWKDLVDLMVSRGADGTPEQFATIVKYLAKNFGPPPAK